MNKASIERLYRGLMASLILHIAMALLAALTPAIFPFFGGSMWGSEAGGEDMRVQLVSSMAGVPLPAPAVVREGATANESAGFYESERELRPLSEGEAEAPLAAEVLKFPKTVRPAATRAESVRSSVSGPDQAQKGFTDNTVPFGQGGRPSINYGQGVRDGSGVEAIGEGAFGELYKSYVDTITRRISQNWLQSTIDINLRNAPRIYINFDILRDGTIANIGIAESSGNRSLDRSAQRAVYASTPLAPLPAQYRGRSVSVNFWFEFTKQ